MSNQKIALLLSCICILTTVPGKTFSDEKIAPTTIEECIDSSALSSALWGIAIKDLKSDEYLLEHHANKAFIPASVTKLFTTTASLQELGSDYRFCTKVYSTAPVDKDGSIKGNIILKGSGDPTFTLNSLQALVRQLKLHGVKSIVGSVIADDTHFQGTRRITHSEWEDLTWYYCPELSALTLNENFITVKISPGSCENHPPLIEVEQAIPYLRVSANVKTVTEKEPQSSTLDVHRGVGDNHLFISGEISKESPTKEFKIAIHNPTEYARLSFIHELEMSGISIKSHRIEKRGGDLYPLAEHFSDPLKEIIRTANKKSDNLVAELIFLEASLARRQLEEEEVLDPLKRELAIDNNRFQIHSGSGLSRHNCLTPHDVCSLLKYLYFPCSSSIIVESLPLAGVDGTLKERFRGTLGEGNIRAKTGSLSGVCSLAGYATTLQERKLCFCLFVNHASQDASTCRDEVDRLLLKIMEQY